MLRNSDLVSIERTGDKCRQSAKGKTNKQTNSTIALMTNTYNDVVFLKKKRGREGGREGVIVVAGAVPQHHLHHHHHHLFFDERKKGRNGRHRQD